MWASAQAWGVHVSESMRKVQKVSLQYRGQCMVHYMVHCTLAEARLEKALHTKAILAMERLYLLCRGYTHYGAPGEAAAVGAPPVALVAHALEGFDVGRGQAAQVVDAGADVAAGQPERWGTVARATLSTTTVSMAIVSKRSSGSAWVVNRRPQPPIGPRAAPRLAPSEQHNQIPGASGPGKTSGGATQWNFAQASALATVPADATLVILAVAREVLRRVEWRPVGGSGRRRRAGSLVRRVPLQCERRRALRHPLLLTGLVADDEHLRRGLHPNACRHPPHQHAVPHLEVVGRNVLPWHGAARFVRDAGPSENWVGVISRTTSAMAHRPCRNE